MSSRNGALEKMRFWLASGEWPIDSRIPPERDLAEQLGISRGVLRLALQALEAEGHIWRHVGKGTFVGPGPPEGGADITELSSRTSPAEVMITRLILEPSAARIAALNATPTQIAEMRHCLVQTRSARTFQQYVIWDNRLHIAVANATRNTLLISFLETLQAIRRTAVWAKLRDKEQPSADNPSLDEHDRIVNAIEDRDPERAAAAMLEHLSRVHAELGSMKYW